MPAIIYIEKYGIVIVEIFILQRKVNVLLWIDSILNSE